MPAARTSGTARVTNDVIVERLDNLREAVDDFRKDTTARFDGLAERYVGQAVYDAQRTSLEKRVTDLESRSSRLAWAIASFALTVAASGAAAFLFGGR